MPSEKDVELPDATVEAVNCDERASVEKMESLLVDWESAKVAVDECLSSTVAKLAPVYRALLAVPRALLPRPFGYGIEERVLDECVPIGGAVDRAFRQVGICRRMEMADVVLSCLGPTISYPLGTVGGTGVLCKLPDDIREHYATGERERWLSIPEDGLPSGVLRQWRSADERNRGR